MLLQHGESKGQPGNTASYYWKRKKERGDKRGGGGLEMEHILVTYLPIGWVQTNKMEKVNVIPGDEWISLDIYLQWRYSKSPAWLITVRRRSTRSHITITDVLFPPLHHIIYIYIVYESRIIAHGTLFYHVLSSKRMCLWPPKGLFLRESAFFWSFPPAEVIKGLLVNRYSCSLTCANCFMPSAACALDFDIEKIRDREERVWYPLWKKTSPIFTCDQALFTCDRVKHMW